jgi:hypothetical protein
MDIWYQSMDVDQPVRHCSVIYIYSFIHEWFYGPLLLPGLFFSSVIFFTQTVRLLGHVISPSQGRYLYKGQHKHTLNAHSNIHALSDIRTHEPSIRANEDGAITNIG